MFVVPFDGGSVKSMHSQRPRLNGSFEMILTTLKRNDSMIVRRCVTGERVKWLDDFEDDLSKGSVSLMNLKIAMI